MRLRQLRMTASAVSSPFSIERTSAAAERRQGSACGMEASNRGERYLATAESPAAKLLAGTIVWRASRAGLVYTFRVSGSAPKGLRDPYMQHRFAQQFSLGSRPTPGQRV